MKVKLRAFLISALHEDEWSASRFGRFTSVQTASDKVWTGGWLAPHVQSWRCDEGNNLLPPRIELRFTIRVASSFTDDYTTQDQNYSRMWLH
jgi:hypothetical protein